MDTRTWRRTAAIAALGFAAGACGDSTGVHDASAVSLSFRVTEHRPAPAAAVSGGPAPAAPMQAVAGAPMVLAGTNGTLTIDEILVIVNEVELKPADGSCDAIEDASDDDDCPEFEAPPRVLDLPLDGSPVAAVTALIAPGTYKELDFEVEDLEDDEDDAADAAAIAAVRAQLLASVPDWPREASARISGTFESVAGGSIDFRVFLKAEIEVEMELVPNLVVSEDGSASYELTVDVAPGIWFTRADGTVVPLHLHDFDLTHELLEFELEIEDGFVEVEVH